MALGAGSMPLGGANLLFGAGNLVLGGGNLPFRGGSMLLREGNFLFGWGNLLLVPAISPLRGRTAAIEGAAAVDPSATLEFPITLTESGRSEYADLA